jgi:hypothetical protein
LDAGTDAALAQGIGGREMGKTYEGGALARRVFLLVVAGVGLEIIVMFMIMSSM